MVAEDLEKEIQEITNIIVSQGFTVREGSTSVGELQYLSYVAQRCNAKMIGEIGFHIGFSSLAFLRTNPEIKVISFDVGEYEYVKLAKKIIDQKFPGRHTLIYGDSRKTVPVFKKSNPEFYFDLIFIDGGHDYNIAKADIKNMRLLSIKETCVVMDDITPWLSWGTGPTRAWKEAVKEGIIAQKELYKDGKLVTEIEPPGERSWVMGRYIF